MKKIICILLSLLMLSAFTACDNANAGENAEKAYTFSANGISIAVGGEKAPVVSALGEPRKIDRTGSCKTEEMDETYYYGGFDLRFEYSTGKGYLVYMIELKDDTVKTPEGIAIGSSRDAVLSAYGTPTLESSGNLIYRKGGTELTILFGGDTVEVIRYSPLTSGEESK